MKSIIIRGPLGVGKSTVAKMAEHDKIIKGYSDRLSFVRLTEQEYRLENI